MQIFPDSTPHYVTDGEQAQPTRTSNSGGLFGGCGFLGLMPQAPQYVGANQPVGCPNAGVLGGLFNAAQPNYVQPEPPSKTTTALVRTLPTK